MEPNEIITDKPKLSFKNLVSNINSWKILVVILGIALISTIYLNSKLKTQVNDYKIQVSQLETQVDQLQKEVDEYKNQKFTDHAGSVINDIIDVLK